MKNIKLKPSTSNLIISLSSAFALYFTATQSLAIENSMVTSMANNQQNSIEQSTTEQAANISQFSDAELEQMLAPIALYPDALLSHILIAATYPIEVVDAERWLEKNNQFTDQERADAAENKDWDASVKALLPFQNILKKLSNDLRWMRNIGDAFLQNQAQVLASVQSLRQQADIAGNLDKMDNVDVVRETKTIIIKPAQPEVIYVPYYDTRVVYGNWRWSRYPPIYWHYPSHYAAHHGPYYWHNPVHLTLGLFFGSVHWNNHHVVVHHHKSRYYKHHSKKWVSTSYQSQKWQHNPRHRKGVAYRTTSIQKKYRSHTHSVQHHKVLRSENLRSGKTHVANRNKHNVKRTSALHKNVSHKLKTNQAIKINKHTQVNRASAKHEAYKNTQWQKPKTHKAVKNRSNTKYVSQTKNRTKVHSAVKKDTRHYNAVKSQPVKRNYTKSNTVKNNNTVAPKRTQKKSYNSSHKRSVTKVARTSHKSNNARSNRGQQKKRN